MTRRQQKDESRRMMPEEKENSQCQHDEAANRFSDFPDDHRWEDYTTEASLSRRAMLQTAVGKDRANWRSELRQWVEIQNARKNTDLRQTPMQTADAKVACMSMAVHGIHRAAN